MLMDKDLGFGETIKYARKMIKSNRKALIKVWSMFVLIWFYLFYLFESAIFEYKQSPPEDVPHGSWGPEAGFIFNLFVCFMLAILIGIYVKKIFTLYIYEENMTNKEVRKFARKRYWLYLVVMWLIVNVLFMADYVFISGMKNILVSLPVGVIGLICKGLIFGIVVIVENLLITFISLLRYEVSVNTESLLGIGDVFKVIRYKFKEFCWLTFWNIFMNIFFGIIVVVAKKINFGMTGMSEMDKFSDSIAVLICFMVVLSVGIVYMLFYDAVGVVKYYNMKNMLGDSK